MRDTARRWALRALFGLQRHTLYRRLGRRFGRRAIVREAGETERAAVRSFLGLRHEERPEAKPPLLVACFGRQVAAWAWVAERPEDDELFPGASVWTLGVRPRFRGLGLGTALLDAAVTRAQDRSCDRVSAVVGVGNSVALRMYAKHGFVEHRTPALDAYLRRRREHGTASIVLVRWLG